MSNPKPKSKNEASNAPLSVSRREFLTHSAATAGAAAVVAGDAVPASADSASTLTFAQPDSLFHGHQWQSLNPGYWQIRDGALRRRLTNYGDRARRTGFPYHGETHGFDFSTEYDPSLESGILYAPQWDLTSDFALKVKFTYRGDSPKPAKGDDPNWLMYQPGFGLMGVAIGSESVFESYGKIIHAIRIGWTDDAKLRILGSPKGPRSAQGGSGVWRDQILKTGDAFPLEAGDECELSVTVQCANKKATIQVVLTANGQTAKLTHTLPQEKTAGFVGVASRGLIDFEVNEFQVEPHANQPRSVGTADCLVCYPLGDTLQQLDNDWHVRFVGMFASDGKKVDVRVSPSESPDGGWLKVPVAGSAEIVNNQWRRNTAVIDVTLPANPGMQTLYYTVWKDGKDVTADGRVGTDACGPGTGLVGDVPSSGRYVGRLPQLQAPYKLCGLSCHSLLSGLQQRKQDGGWAMKGGRDRWLFRDQPTVEAYKHLEDYDFQVMVWEDDVWYMELAMYPPSTDDAYKTVALSICGPASRWQMMRHWNVINPGDHDYGMDDVKGPEQIVIRKTDGLGQDPAYMRRNFQIVHHLITGDEEVDPYVNPKKWRAWKMPNRDFTFVILDSRLWRSSQDVDVWDDQGWGAFKSLYDRTDPTRSLLGEEQFGWLQELLSADSSPLICLTGVNGMHTVWAGAKNGRSASKDHPMNFEQRDRVTADYAGWVKAGADRVLELLGARQGIVSVYGDVHNGSIMTNTEHRVIECSFGPIGRTGGRAVIPGFGPRMKDVDERELEMHALYHKDYASPDLEKHGRGDPVYWNFLEMEFDPSQADPTIGLRVRNLVDAPADPPRGGAALETVASKTGRVPSCKLPEIRTLPNADVYFADRNGQTIRGTRSDAQGRVHVSGLVDVKPGAKVVVNAFDGEKAEAQVVTTS
ncbi:MAG: alkaline phosphatase D family protein [Rubripirellula sp.]